ncbi:MAG: HEAT repeat domain-containing protein [Nitrospinales bacterium]
MGRVTNILIALIAVMTIFVLMIKMSGESGPRYPEGIVTSFPSQGEWIRPEKGMEELADALSVQELIDRWNRWPQDASKDGVHKVYADALALYKEEAQVAIPHLGKAVTHLNPNLRKSVMFALSSIGDGGVPHLVKALELWPPRDPNKRAVHIREDAAQFLSRSAKNGFDISSALPALRKCLLDPSYSPFARQHAARAVTRLETPEAKEILEEAKTWFYAQDGLSVEENRILKNINIGLTHINSVLE